MNVRELVFRDDPSAETKLYACGECGACYSPKNVGVQNAIDMAKSCCVPARHTCRVCGAAIPKYRTLCKRHAEQAQLRKAAQIDAKDWSDPVQHDEAPGGWNGEGYFSSPDELREHWEDHHWITIGPQVPPPAYCWPCIPRTLLLDPERILDQALEDMPEEAADEIVDADDLFDFIEAWNAKQTCVTWYPDHSRVVVLDRKRFNALIDGEGLADA